MASELKVIADFYDLALYLTQRVEKFPRHHRASDATACPVGTQRGLRP